MRFKFITLNVWRGGVLMDNVIHFIKKEDPDILTLQEVQNGYDKTLPENFRTIELFKKNLEYKNYYYSPSFAEKTKYGLVDNGSAILSRYPFEAAKTVFIEFYYRQRSEGTNSDKYSEENIQAFLNTPRNLQWVDIKIGKSELSIFNLHGIWGLDGKDNPRRLQMGEKIIEEIRKKENVILAGDFNMQPDTQTIANIEKYVRNVFKDELESTFNMKRKTNSELRKAAVDMVFASSKIKVIDHYCPIVDVSDHLPLVCVFEIK